VTIDDTPDSPHPPPGLSATAPPAAPRPAFPADREGLWPSLAALAAAMVGHLPLLGAWWCRDDWGLLARAAGLIERPSGIPARWLSQHLYWQATWPLWGLDPAPHALVRLALHGLSALLVVRLGRRGGLTPAAAALGGFVFGASPLAFTPVYWAAGIQELLAATLALLAIDLWLAAGRRGRGAMFAAMLAGLGALAAKESALGLALLLGALTCAGAGPGRSDRKAAWGVIVVLLTAAVGAGFLATRLFNTGAGGPYETGGITTLLANLGFSSRWLLMPGPIVGISPSWTAAMTGGLLLTGWTVWGAWRWRRRDRLPLAALLGALLSLAPVLPLRHHLAPYMAYLAVAGWALALGTLVPRRLPLPRVALAAALVVFSAWGLFSSRSVLSRRNELGLPADDIVRATSLSWEAAGLLRSLDSVGDRRPIRQVTLLQIPAGPGALEFAERYGENWAGRTDLHEALGGDLGPRLLVPTGVVAHWRNGLVTAPDSALVLVETGTGLRPWGRTGQAALYAALTDIGLGNFERGRGHLLRAGRLGGKAIGFACDEGLLPIPLALAAQQREAFIDWTVGLLGQKSSRAEVGGLQDTYLNLLCACTGRSLDELTRGSRILLPADPVAKPDPRN
jgi:hypothetical protein